MNPAVKQTEIEAQFRKSTTQFKTFQAEKNNLIQIVKPKKDFAINDPDKIDKKEELLNKENKLVSQKSQMQLQEPKKDPHEDSFLNQLQLIRPVNGKLLNVSINKKRKYKETADRADRGGVFEQPAGGREASDSEVAIRGQGGAGPVAAAAHGLQNP